MEMRCGSVHLYCITLRLWIDSRQREREREKERERERKRGRGRDMERYGEIRVLRCLEKCKMPRTGG